MISFAHFSALVLLTLSMLNAQTSNRLGWSRYLPGGDFDVATSVLVEPSGDVWVAGHSAGQYDAYGPNEPFQTKNAGRTDIFLVKYRINPDGSATTLFFTWLGGTDVEELVDMKFDRQGRIVLTGITNSNNFPMAASPFQNVAGGDFDVFVSVVDPNQGGAASLVYSTYYGGTGRELAKALAVGPTGNIAVVGTTIADGIPGVGNGAQPVRRGNSDAFVIYFNPRANGLSYASYLGGSGNDSAVSVVLDNSNRIWFAGSTGSPDFPLTDNGPQANSTGFFDGYIAAIDPSRSGLSSFIYGTLIGGSGSDEARGLALDANGKLWVAGITFSKDFPTTPQAAQRTLAGGTDAFVMQIDPALSGTAALLYSSYVGGTGFEFVYGLSLVGDSRAAIAGYSMSGQLPVTGNALRSTPASAFADGMVALINSSTFGSEGLEYLSYFGGSSTDVINSVSFDPANPRMLFVAGYTTSTDLVTTDGTTKANPAPAPNAFAAKIIR
ncbi:MAG: hypothetical protein FJW36_09865 [Acidobacteria bacterium]|nr:hypothetical protein [Acidobacteriota bacterium]